MRTVDDAGLAALVGPLRALLGANDHPDKADWLAARERDLRSGEPEQAATARAELRGIVHGMGGLIDLYLPSAMDRERLTVLTERIWEATKS
jgi:hypothetical protein